jgi:hypothetical protein
MRTYIDGHRTHYLNEQYHIRPSTILEGNAAAILKEPDYIRILTNRTVIVHRAHSTPTPEIMMCVQPNSTSRQYHGRQDRVAVVVTACAIHTKGCPDGKMENGLPLLFYNYNNYILVLHNTYCLTDDYSSPL